MNTLRKLIRFLLGIVLFACTVWGVVELISTGDMVASTPYLVPVFVFYFMFDVIIRITDLEARMKVHYEIIFSVCNMTCKPNLPKVESKTEEGKETT